MAATHALSVGRRAYDRKAWREAWEALSRAAEGGPLQPDDLGRLAISAFLIGRDDDFIAALERAHNVRRASGEIPAAVRDAFWIGFHLTNRGEMARASGWFSRAQRLLDAAEGDHVERGYLLIPPAHKCFATGEHEAAYTIAGEAAALGEQFGDRDLLAIAVHLQGRARVAQARVPEGLKLLDEAMVAASAGELSPPVTGLIYCSVIGACRSVYALGRAHEWTTALSEWCEKQPDMVAFTGECRVYRSELMQLRGAWDEAITEARRVGERQPEPPAAASALAAYQRGEVHRLRGEFATAEDAYRAASRGGRQPQPGLALLRLAQGEPRTAASAIQRALDEVADPLRRARLLPAHIEIMLAVDEIDAARRGCRELEEIAATYGTDVLATLATHAEGAVDLAAGDAAGALPRIRRAWQGWHDLGATYEAARARLLLGLACRELGDDDTADREIQAARDQLGRLGAAPDLQRLDRLIADHAPGDHGLTPRELEVLSLVATGRTNRAVAEELYISERTVARHVSNIFAKLGLSSRAAATAYAYQHGLAGPVSG